MCTSVVQFCDLLLEKAKLKYGEPMLTNQHLHCQDILLGQVDEVLRFIEDLSRNDASIITTETLDIDDEETISHDDGDDFEEETNSPDSQQMSQDWELLHIGNAVYSLDRIKSVLEFYDKCSKNKLYQTKRRYPFVTDSKMIVRFRKYLEQNGRKSDKLKQLEDFVTMKFVEARTSYASVSERDLFGWGIQIAKELELDFRASRNWLHNFKKGNRIVSRKITKLTTRREIDDHDQLMENANQFVENLKKECEDVPSKCIWNFDQSGFNYEHSNFRTLSHKGEKDTLMLVKSMKSVTHSYSVMPLLSMDGVLAPKLLICLQETTGDFGPRVKKSMKVPPNIFVTSSKSGKLDKRIMKDWADTVVAQVSPSDEMVLIYDSWAGQTDPNLYNGIPNLRSTFQIPAKTTQWIQPLDNYFFRQYKIVRRKICDRVMLEDVKMDLHKRENVLLMHSLIYNQFQSPVFAPMLRYSWFKCGYTTNRPGHFMNANEILFETVGNECDEEECEHFCFIKCSHCKMNLCINHFLLKNHFHIM